MSENGKKLYLVIIDEDYDRKFKKMYAKDPKDVLRQVYPDRCNEILSDRKLNIGVDEEFHVYGFMLFDDFEMTIIEEFHEDSI